MFRRFGIAPNTSPRINPIPLVINYRDLLSHLETAVAANWAAVRKTAAVNRALVRVLGLVGKLFAERAMEHL